MRCGCGRIEDGRDEGQVIASRRDRRRRREVGVGLGSSSMYREGRVHCGYNTASLICVTTLQSTHVLP